MLNFVREWKSVSDDTVAIASSIGNEILKNSKTVQKKYSKIKGILIKENEFPWKPEGLLGELEELIIEYTIYYCDNENDYQRLLRFENLNCSADYFDAYIRIKMAYVGDILKDDFIDDIQHEINHLLQYSKGYKKSKRTNNLYNTVSNIVQDIKLSQIYKTPAMLIYYTFRHEEDSFTAQYYSYLRRTYKKLSELDVDGGFEMTIKNFQPYKNIINLIKIYNDNINNKEIINCINQMNMEQISFENRVDKGVKRLRVKLLHAYERLCMELDRCNTIDSVVRHNMIIYENYGSSVQECIEKDYEIKGIDF
jgi:hypothetical protein